MVQTRKTDRRTVYTRNVIKDAMLELLEIDSFDKITVASVCRQAQIGRSTFYNHYDDLMQVIDDLEDDAVMATKPALTDSIKGIEEMARLMQKANSINEISDKVNLLPLCQRIADNPKYHCLFRDPLISEYMLMRIYRQEKNKMAPQLTSAFHIKEEEADMLFLFLIQGAFAVNRAMNWKKDDAWFRVQRVLLTFISSGYKSLCDL